MPLSDTQGLKMYRFMKLVRLLDERMIALQRQGRIGFYGAATGEEAAVIGSAQALEPGDWVFPALRQGGVLLYRGLPLDVYIAQVYGNTRDIHKGHQMPCHYSHRQFNHVAWSPCMATHLPHAVGAAYAARYLKEKSVMIAYLGDGATSEGDFHVALNFAGVFKVPVVFFCQNNQWAISVPFSRQTASSDVAVKAVAYGIEGIRVDGNDVMACYEVTQQAIDKARSGQGPTLIEAVTYRLGAHSTSDDPRLYRDETEVSEWKKWKQKDPIERFKSHLEKKNLWNDSRENDLITELQNDITASVERVESLSDQSLDTLIQDVYAEVPQPLLEQFRSAFP